MDKRRSYRDPKAPLEPHHIPLDKAAELETHPGVLAAINAVATESRPVFLVVSFLVIGYEMDIAGGAGTALVACSRRRIARCPLPAIRIARRHARLIGTVFQKIELARIEAARQHERVRRDAEPQKAIGIKERLRIVSRLETRQPRIGEFANLWLR